MGKWLACALVAALPFTAQAQGALQGLDRGMVGPRTQLLVLGTMHLREMPASFNPAALDGLLDRVAAFKPGIITIEAEPGEECDLALRHPAKYGADYCALPAAAQAATGLDIPAALAEADRTLKAWPAQVSPAQRRRLAAVFLAANDRASAYVQWLHLPDAEANVSAQLRARSAQGYPQIWVAGWEIRNLRMVANIREAFREKPGARVLSLVGVSHKPWFDAWLGQLQGVEIVDAAQVLK
jgi:hypothetical protein